MTFRSAPFSDPTLPRRARGAGDPNAPAGIAGLDSRLATQRWTDENKHTLDSPGAYEWWYFHALSPDGDGIIFAIFHGLPFRPPQLTSIHRPRASASAIEKGSDPHSAPLPAAYLAVYQQGKKVAQFLNIYPPDSVSGDSNDIRVGPNRITLRQDGSIGIIARGYPFDVGRRGPRPRTDLNLSAQLTFTPTFVAPPLSRPFRHPAPNHATHHWIIAGPHGKVTGSVQLVNAKEHTSLLAMDVNTNGYHDHVYGHGPLASGISKQFWGFLQGDDWTVAWNQTLGKSEPDGRAGGLVFFQKKHKPVVIESPDSEFEDSQVGRWLMRYPGKITMHGSDEKGHPIEFLLNHHALLDGAPFHTGIAASGSISIPGRGTFSGIGTTHLLQLRRLKWPLLSDITLFAITLVQRDDPLWQQ